MPTYDFRCEQCGRLNAVVLSISEYINHRPALYCCAAEMDRFISVVPALAVANALASERHYDGMRATDGSDISTRAKHRAYMKERGLTTVDDFSATWAREAEQRKERLAGNDPTRVHDVQQAIQKLGG